MPSRLILIGNATVIDAFVQLIRAMFESTAPKIKFGGFGGSNENVATKNDPKPNRKIA